MFQIIIIIQTDVYEVGWVKYIFCQYDITNTNKFIIRNKAHTCMRAGTNVKQVINMNVHYKTK